MSANPKSAMSPFFGTSAPNHRNGRGYQIPHPGHPGETVATLKHTASANIAEYPFYPCYGARIEFWHCEIMLQRRRYPRVHR
jgi:hypothetical protein